MNPHSKSNRFLLVLGLALAGIVVLGVVRLRDWQQAEVQAAANLKDIGLALNVYESRNLVLPIVTDNPVRVPSLPNSTGATSKLSWRVAILPYIDETDLYWKFHHDEPWDSPHNLQLLSEMPAVYLNPRMQSSSDREKGLTHWQVFMGEGTPMGGKPVPFTAMTPTGGVPPIFLVVEAREPVPWTKPEDIPYSPDRPFPKLGDPDRTEFLAVFLEGKVRKIRHNVSERSLRASVYYTIKDRAPPPWK